MGLVRVLRDVSHDRDLDVNDRHYSVDYFNGQVCEFIDLCGTRKFWEAAQRVRDNAVKALGWVYMRTEGAESWRFEVVIINYTCREVLCLMEVHPDG